MSELAKLVPSTLSKEAQGSQALGTGVWTKECLWPDVSHADLLWWLELAPTLKWKWARTYAKTAPHWYLQREIGYCTLTLEEYHRALSVIWTFGRLERFYRSANVYLHDEATGWKWWAMGRPDYGIALINMAAASLTYDQ